MEVKLKVLGLLVIVAEVILGCSLLFGQLNDVQVQDHLVLVQVGEVCAEIEAAWRKNPQAIVTAHQIKWADVRYEIQNDRLVRIKDEIPEELLIHLSPDSIFSKSGEVLSGVFHISLAHDKAQYPLYAKGSL